MNKDKVFQFEPESDTLEYKEIVNDKYLKTVCAFSNQNGGKIVFGITDDLKVKSVKKINLTLEFVINEIITKVSPIPFFNIMENKFLRTIHLEVFPSNNPPYFYKNKTYFRHHSSTVPATNKDLGSLIENRNIFELDEKLIKKDDLTFNSLSREFNNINKFFKWSNDVFHIFELKENQQFNVAALYLSDQNNLPGIEVLIFQKNPSHLMEKLVFESCSVLDQLNDVFNIFQQKYVHYPKKVNEKYSSELIPFKAFRSSLINIIVHQNFNIKTRVKVKMYNDKVEIISPGNLLLNFSSNIFKHFNSGIIRNKILENVLKDIKWYEGNYFQTFKTISAYNSFILKPQTIKSNNVFAISLPLLKKDFEILKHNYLEVYRLLVLNKALSNTQIANCLKIKQYTVTRILNKLITLKLISKSGSTKNALYFLAK